MAVSQATARTLALTLQGPMGNSDLTYAVKKKKEKKKTSPTAKWRTHRGKGSSRDCYNIQVKNAGPACG